MKIIVNKHNLTIEKEPVNEKEINVSKIEFEFEEEMTNDFVKEAYFTTNGQSYVRIIFNNECSIPYEVLEQESDIEIGVVVYKVEDEETIIRYNPSPVYIHSLKGSLKDAENSEPITPSEMEQYMQLLESGLEEVANVDIDLEELEQGTKVIITNRDGQEKETTILNGVDGKDGFNGVGLNYNWNGTSLGVKREDEQNYRYTNLKGDTGNPGQDGVDGVSPTITSSKSGSTTTITITDKTGITTATINDGTNGTNGQDGYTPVRGVDYWTSSDIQTIQSYCDNLVLGALGGSY